MNPSTKFSQEIIKILIKKEFKICTIESFTGGLISHYLSSISGASQVFLGSIVSYSNKVKNDLLSISEADLVKYHPASIEVLEQMLQSGIKIFQSDFCIASTGIAGPSGQTINKPLGSVYLGVMHKNGTKRIFNLCIKGNRNAIQKEATFLILKHTLNFLASF